MKAADSIKTIEHYIESCLIRGSCTDCPFYCVNRDQYLSSKCMGPKQYGVLLQSMVEDIKKELGYVQTNKKRKA